MNSYRWVFIEKAKELSISPRSPSPEATSFNHFCFYFFSYSSSLTPCTVFVLLCLHLNSIYWLLAVKDGDIAHLGLYFYSLLPIFKIIIE